MNYNIMCHSTRTNDIITLLFVVSLIIITADCQIDKPDTFGLLTVTHIKGTTIAQFKDFFLKHYAQLECDIISEINVVWNNQQLPETYDLFSEKENWKRPVYFYNTKHNSMDQRYRLTPQSKAKVFFSVDDDVNVGCQQLTKGFEIWKSESIGDLGPLMSYGPTYFQYTYQKGISFTKAKQRRYFSFGLTGRAFISRHYLELYYSEVPLIQQMRQRIKAMNFCEEIGLNWIINYYYPQFWTRALFGNLTDLTTPIQLLRKSYKLEEVRTLCLNRFTTLFGMNPFRYMPLVLNTTNQKRQSGVPLMRQTIIQKKMYIEKYIIKKQLSEEDQRAAEKIKQEEMSAAPDPHLPSDNQQQQKPSDAELKEMEIKLLNSQQKLQILEKQFQNYKEQTKMQQKTLIDYFKKHKDDHLVNKQNQADRTALIKGNGGPSQSNENPTVHSESSQKLEVNPSETKVSQKIVRFSIVQLLVFILFVGIAIISYKIYKYILLAHQYQNLGEVRMAPQDLVLEGGVE